MTYYDTSALTGLNLETMMNDLFGQTYAAKYAETEPKREPTIIISRPTEAQKEAQNKPNGGCC